MATLAPITVVGGPLRAGRAFSLDRVIRTELPNGTDSRVEFDAWQHTTRDPNDTVLESAWYEERTRAAKPVPNKSSRDHMATIQPTGPIQRWANDW